VVPGHSDSKQRSLDLQALQSLVREKCYSVRSHAVDHMFKEDFGERHIVEAILTGQVLEEYPEDCRCLILGYPHLDGDTTIPLHVVCDYYDPVWVDIVTAYVPQRPWWMTPTQRGRGVK